MRIDAQVKGENTYTAKNRWKVRWCEKAYSDIQSLPPTRLELVKHAFCLEFDNFLPTLQDSYAPDATKVRNEVRYAYKQKSAETQGYILEPNVHLARFRRGHK